MELDRHGKKYPGGVIVFDTPVPVRYEGCRTWAVGYTEETRPTP